MKSDLLPLPGPNVGDPSIWQPLEYVPPVDLLIEIQIGGYIIFIGPIKVSLVK